MRNETRVLFNQYLQNQQQLNGVPDATTKFTVTPSIQQRLETRIQESASFLGLINVVPVNEIKGEKIGLGVAGTIASRTDTSGSGERETRDITALDDQGYECKQTNYDHHIRYATLDAWAKFPDFQVRVRNSVLQRAALDRMMIGFNGTSAAATTNSTTNPLLQDVNIGWLKHIETNAPAQVMSDGASAGANSIKVGVGAGNDYKNLDSLVLDAYKSLLDPWYRDDAGLVVIVGRELVHDKAFGLVDAPTDPSEKLAADIILRSMKLGGLTPVVVPYFPANSLLVTRLDNLSIYYQDGTRRRAVMDNPKRDRIEHYESSNDAFVFEDYGMCALVKNIDLVA